MPVNIFNLPPELLEKIFRYLPKANDRRRVAQVSRTFYQIIRRQSKKLGTLYLTNKAPDKSSVRVFKDSTTFPFSKLNIGEGVPDMILDQDFWLEHGQFITELTINGRFSFHSLTFFPYLKRIKLDWLSELLIEENCPKIQLPELCIGDRFSMDEISYILQCCPSLKTIELSMGSDHFKRLAELLPWIESIETVKMSIQRGVELKDILELPSKVVLQRLKISSDTSVETIASFFNSPRHIETLRLEFPFNTVLRFTKDKILPLLKAESINKLVLSSQIPEFPGSLDLLAQVPGLQEISISLDKKIFLPHYWSNPNTASKIHEIELCDEFDPKVLTGLSSLSSLTIQNFGGNLEVLRNHPKLKKLVIEWFDGGNAELEPISSLHDLEILELNRVPNVTIDAFKTTIKFQKLIKLFISSGQMKNDVAMMLPENCPNLEILTLVYDQRSFDMKDSLDDAKFEHLIRALPYLKDIKIFGGRLTVSKDKEQQMKIEFPYLKIIVVKRIKVFSQSYQKSDR